MAPSFVEISSEILGDLEKFVRGQGQSVSDDLPFPENSSGDCNYINRPAKSI